MAKTHKYSASDEQAMDAFAERAMALVSSADIAEAVSSAEMAAAADPESDRDAMLVQLGVSLGAQAGFMLRREQELAEGMASIDTPFLRLLAERTQSLQLANLEGEGYELLGDLHDKALEQIVERAKEAAERMLANFVQAYHLPSSALTSDTVPEGVWCLIIGVHAKLQAEHEFAAWLIFTDTDAGRELTGCRCPSCLGRALLHAQLPEDMAKEMCVLQLNERHGGDITTAMVSYGAYILDASRASYAELQSLIANPIGVSAEQVSAMLHRFARGPEDGNDTKAH